jgi:predicted nucleotide-binding protein
LRELIADQSKLIEGLSRKIATNDKILENIDNRMDSFAFVIKNQHSFNKMIESQIAQLAAVKNYKSCQYSQCRLLHRAIAGKVDRLFFA